MSDDDVKALEALRLYKENEDLRNQLAEAKNYGRSQRSQGDDYASLVQATIQQRDNVISISEQRQEEIEKLRNQLLEARKLELMNAAALDVVNEANAALLQERDDLKATLANRETEISVHVQTIASLRAELATAWDDASKWQGIATARKMMALEACEIGTRVASSTHPPTAALERLKSLVLAVEMRTAPVPAEPYQSPPIMSNRRDADLIERDVHIFGIGYGLMRPDGRVGHLPAEKVYVHTKTGPHKVDPGVMGQWGENILDKLRKHGVVLGITDVDPATAGPSAFKTINKDGEKKIAVRGVDFPCETCGEKAGSECDHRGFYRCNACGYPGQ